MLIQLFKDVAPPVLLAGTILYGGAHYLLIAPKIAERVVAADHLPACRADLAALAVKSGEEKLASIPLPAIDPMRDYAIKQAERIYKSPLMEWAYGASQGLGGAIGLDPRGAVEAARRTYEANERAAREAYERAREEVQAWTQSQLGAAGDSCACVGQRAVEANRMEWALYTGSLSLYVPAPIASFDRQMANVFASGACEAGGGAS